MIRPLRARHRTTWTLLAVGLPVMLALALRARAPVPTSADVPPVDAPDAAALDEPVQLTFQRDDLWGALPVRTRLLIGSTRHSVELQPLRDLRQPDVLAYWLSDPTLPPGGDVKSAGGGMPASAGVPAGALLLGRLAGTQPRRFALPPQADLRRGALLLYSLGHQQTLGMARLPENAAGS